MKKIYFLVLITFLLFSGCGGLTEKKVVELLQSTENFKYSYLDNISTKVLFIEVNSVLDANYNPKKSIYTGYPPVELAEQFAQWLLRKGFIINNEVDGRYFKNFSEAGYDFIKRNENSFIRTKNLTSRFAIFKRKTPQIIGIRDIGNNSYEVIYRQEYELANEIDYVRDLIQYFNKVKLPDAVEVTVTYRKYGDEWRGTFD